jgi:hypothetical protein
LGISTPYYPEFFQDYNRFHICCIKYWFWSAGTYHIKAELHTEPSVVYTSIAPALEKLRQKDLQFKASLGNTTSNKKLSHIPTFLLLCAVMPSCRAPGIASSLSKASV